MTSSKKTEHPTGADTMDHLSMAELRARIFGRGLPAMLEAEDFEVQPSQEQLAQQPSKAKKDETY
jgi:uncharacterized small protein (DUF1192 family)